MLEQFAYLRTILLAFGASVSLFLAFQWVYAGIGNGPILDTLLTGNDARSRLAEMTVSEINRHLIGTLTIDMLFPVAYGIFFAGLLFRLVSSWRISLEILPLIGALFDIMENMVQAIAMVGVVDLLNAKIFLTVPKFVFFILSASLMTILIFSALFKHLTKWSLSKS